MKSSSSRFSFRRSMVCMLFVFVLVAFISVTGTSTAVYAETFTVTTTIDDVSDSGSLRYAINHATSQDVITFELDYPAIITLDEQLSIDHGLTIEGPGAELLAVSGGGECRVFYIEDTTESIGLSGISIVSGDADNYDLSEGGGIYNRSDSFSVDTCYISGNHANIGGGMCNSDSSPTVTNCTFFLNSADIGGGGMCNDDSSPAVTNCTFFLNSTDTGGGGMYNYESSPAVTNCTFYLNNASHGGAMLNYASSSPTVTNCTFYSNSASNYGGGMFNHYSGPEVTNCIFWGDGGEIYTNTDFLPESNPNLSFCVVQSNDVGDGAISKDIISADPELELLVDNGGPTWTCVLGEGSSAIDAGTSDGAPSSDQRGAPRPLNGSFDIGAYEYGLGYHIITATCSDGGTISPIEAHSLGKGTEDEVFYLVPNEGYVIEVVYVDDVAIDSSEIINNTFTFEDVTENHSIHADFKPGYDGDGCNISALPGVGILLMLPLLFLSGKMK